MSVKSTRARTGQDWSWDCRVQKLAAVTKILNKLNCIITIHNSISSTEHQVNIRSKKFHKCLLITKIIYHENLALAIREQNSLQSP